MKLKIKEIYDKNGKLISRYFVDKNGISQGYDEYNYTLYEKDMYYWVNGDGCVGLEVNGIRKFYTI